MGRKIEVVITGNTTGVSSAFKQAGSEAESFGSKLARVGSSLTDFGKKATIGLTVPILGGLAAAVKAAEESARISKVTDSIIKSTGGVAGITADQISRLSTALSNKTAIDDELIQSGANVLLTFTKVRNEVGKGNDVFNRASAAALDLGAVLGTDVAAANVMLGKALQDPLKGITALTRAGVSFTQQQKDQIKTLVQSGQTLEAQKIILGEIETQVGGAAAANSSAIDRMKISFGNLAEGIGAQLLPFVERFSTFVSGLTERFGTLDPAIQKIAVGAALMLAAIGPLAIVLGAIASPIGLVVAGLAALGVALVAAYRSNDEFRAKVQAAFEWIKTNIPVALAATKLAIQQFVEGVKAAWQRWGDDVQRIAGQAFRFVQQEIIPTLQSIGSYIRSFISGAIDAWRRFSEIRDIVNGALTVIKGVFQSTFAVIQGIVTAGLRLIRGDFSGAMDAIRAANQGALNGLRTIWSGLGQMLSGIISGAWRLGVAAFTAGANAVVNVAAQLANRIVSGLRQLPSILLAIGRQAMQGLLNGITAGAGAVLAKARDLANQIKSAFALPLDINSPSRVFHEYGMNITQGLANGIVAGTAPVSAQMTKLAEQLTAAFKKGNASAVGADFIRSFAAGVTSGTPLPAAAVAKMAEQMRASLGDMKFAAGKGGDAVKAELEKVVAGVEALAARMADAIPSVLGLTRSSRSLSKAQKDEVKATETLNEAKAAAATINQRIQQAEQRLADARARGEEGTGDAADAERDLNDLRRESAELPRRIADATDALTDAQDRTIDAQLALNEAQQKAQAQGPGLIAMFEQMARAAGLSEAQIARLRGEINALQDKTVTVTTNVVTNGSKPTTPGDNNSAGGSANIDSGGRINSGGSFATGAYFSPRPGGHMLNAQFAEAGDAEWVLPDQKLRRTIEDVVSAQMGGSTGQPIVVQVVLDGRVIHESTVSQMRRNNQIDSNGYVKVGR